jgi:hypothetical protein
MKVKDDEIRVLKKETKRLNNYVEKLLGMVRTALTRPPRSHPPSLLALMQQRLKRWWHQITHDEERRQEENKRICELERENQRLRDKCEEEANRAKRYHCLLERCSREKNELRRAFECRRDEIVGILMTPLPACSGVIEERESAI